jgi:hypothetical protein
LTAGIEGSNPAEGMDVCPVYVEATVKGRSLVQRNPTLRLIACGQETSIKRRTRLNVGCGATGKNSSSLQTSSLNKQHFTLMTDETIRAVIPSTASKCFLTYHFRQNVLLSHIFTSNRYFYGTEITIPNLKKLKIKLASLATEKKYFNTRY